MAQVTRPWHINSDERNKLVEIYHWDIAPYSSDGASVRAMQSANRWGSCDYFILFDPINNRYKSNISSKTMIKHAIELAAAVELSGSHKMPIGALEDSTYDKYGHTR